MMKQMKLQGSTSMSADYNGTAATISKFLLSALLLLFLAVTAQRYSWAQAGNAAGSQGAPHAQGQNVNGMHIFIWAGLKSHLPGQHDYPQFLADWSKILTEHGAVVDGALHPPSSADLEHTDVMVIYKGDAGYLIDEEIHDRRIRETRRRPGQPS